MSAPVEPREVSAADEAHLRECRRVEYVHLLCDADPDAETAPFPYPVESLRAVTL